MTRGVQVPSPTPQTCRFAVSVVVVHPAFHHLPEAVVAGVNDIGRALWSAASLPWMLLRILHCAHVCSFR